MRLMAAILFCAFGAFPAQAYKQVLTQSDKVVAWPTDQVSFTIDAVLPPGWDQESVEAVVLASKEPWEELECGELTLEFQGWTQSGTADLFDKKNGVYWIQDDWQFGSALMAITLLEFSKFTGELRDADILVNNNQKTFDVGPICDGSGLNYDLQNILTHEFGHFVGLDHSDDSQATMYADTFEEDCAKKDLHSDDEAGFCATYDRSDTSSAESGDSDAGVGVDDSVGDDEGCQVSTNSSRKGILAPLLFLGLILGVYRRRTGVSI